jgi:ribose transport system substrate-binding protein
MALKVKYIIVGLIFILFAGCKNNDTPKQKSGQASSNKTIVYILPNDGPYYDLKWYGVKSELEMRGYTVKRESAGGYKNISKQLEIIENGIITNVAGMIIHPVSDVAVVPTVEKAINQGIPVIAENVNIQSDKISGSVMLENAANGWEIAMELTSELNGEGSIIALVGPAGQEQASAMWDAAKMYFKKFSQIKIIKEEYLDANAQAAHPIIESALITEPNVKGIYCWYVQNAIGAATAVKQKGYAPGSIKIVAKDIDDQSEALMNEGYISALLVGEPITMGRESAKLIDAIIKGTSCDKHVKLRNYLVTKDLLNKIDRSGFQIGK